MSSRMKSFCFDKSSGFSTCDSSSQPDQQFYHLKTNPLKHKTELCKTYSELGYCNYGAKCRFAHGKHQLIVLPTKTAFRKRKCKGFWAEGCCLYGQRCQFDHRKVEWESRVSILAMWAWACPQESIFLKSKLLNKLKL